ncbi:hypothetical protein P7K49_032163 [Saguinus oedipus]|uniref:L-lactate dehydrogenase B chain n=1 Tax=Saguinus oedipus TaxID=9490 RepID=A0ABQ9TZB7_SAGOE|nr:hypothetical protein P7K49_032163 [Saguinus oedipus]
MTTLKENLIAPVVEEEATVPNNNITTVSVGHVGMACAISILGKSLADELALADVLEDKITGQMMDLQHGSLFLQMPKIVADKDHSVPASAKIVVATAGVHQQEGESRLNVVQRNVNFFKFIITKIIKYNIANLRLKNWRFIPAAATDGFWENMETQVWLCGVALMWQVFLYRNGIQKWELTMIVKIGRKCIRWWLKVPTESSKGYTNWTIGLSVADLIESMLKNLPKIHLVSTMVKGMYGIEREVFLSLPCILNAWGLTCIINQKLKVDEVAQLKRSVDTPWDIQKDLKDL